MTKTLIFYVTANKILKYILSKLSSLSFGVIYKNDGIEKKNVFASLNKIMIWSICGQFKRVFCD